MINLQDRNVNRKSWNIRKATIDDAKNLKIRLTTHVLLTENVSFYLHLGWLEIGRDDTRVYMKKILVFNNG
jgi:hypothetical protein